MTSTSITQIAASTFVYPTEHPEGPDKGCLFLYVVKTPTDTYVIDTGIGSSHAWIDLHYKPSPFDLLSELRLHGVEPSSVSALICSHLHFDHCGNNRLFAGVPIYVQRTEYEAALTKGYTATEWVVFEGADYRLVNGNLRINPWVELMATPGHTVGHQSVVVFTERGCEVVVAQAAYSAAEFASFAADVESTVRDDCWSQEAYVRSLRALHSLEPTRAYFSHDQTVWARHE